MKNKIYSRLPAIMFGVLVVSFLAAFYIFAWTEPTEVPPGGNVPAPVNVSAVDQIKQGSLSLNTAGISPTGLIVNRDAIFLNGNVGIGTAGPTQKLDVAGSIAIAEGAYIGPAGFGHNSGHDNTISFGQAGGAWGGVRVINYFDGSFNNQYVAFDTHHGGVSVGERMRIDRDGNVGIGTTTPGAKLDVAGTLRSTSFYYLNHTSPSIILQDSDHRSGVIHQNSNLMYFLSGSGVNGTSWTINGSYWPLTLNMNNDTATFGGPAYFMEGNVGIGTTTPSERLDVNGNVNISGDLAAAGTLHSFAANGYQRLPSGLIIQWGCYTTTTDNDQSFTFPIAFPNACFNVQTTPNGNASAYPTRVVSTTVSGFTANRHDSLSGNSDFYWFAIGY